MFSRFFIDRPIFAAVISIFFVLAGLAAMRTLPIAQYPEIAPPVVTVQADLSGRLRRDARRNRRRADRERDQRRAGHDLHELELVVQRASVQIQVTFEIGTNVDQAAINVNNRVKQVESRLPQEVRRQGVTVERGSSSFLQVHRVLLAGRPLRRPLHQQLRHAERARPAEAAAGHDERADLRREGLRDAHLAQARSPRAVPPDARRRRAARSTSRTRSSRRARSASRRSMTGQDLVYTVSTRGRLADPQRVRADHRPRESRRLDRAALRRRARRARLEGLRVHRPLQRPRSRR